jgi:hypothetical protein
MRHALLGTSGAMRAIHLASARLTTHIAITSPAYDTIVEEVLRSERRSKVPQMQLLRNQRI